MKPTFKQFLEDIDMIDGEEFSKYDSDNHASEHDHEIKKELKKGVADKFKPFEAPFTNRDFELHHQVKGDKLIVVLLHKKTKDAAVTLTLQKREVNLHGSRVTYWATEVLAGLLKYQGQGLAPLVYQAIIRSHRYVVGSSNEQTEGGAKTWVKILRIIDEPVFVADCAFDDEYRLVKGELPDLKKLAYSKPENFYLVIPTWLAKGAVSKAIDVKAK